MDHPLVARPDTARTLAEGDTLLGRVQPNRILHLTLHIKPAGDKLGEAASALHRQSVRERSHLSRAEFAATHGAKPADLQKVRQFTRQYGLQIVPDHVSRSLSTGPLA